MQHKLSSSLLLQRWQQKSDLGTSSIIGRCKYNLIAIGQQSLAFTNINASHDKTNLGENDRNNPFRSNNDPNNSQKPMKTYWCQWCQHKCNGEKKHIEICNSLSKFSKPLTFSMVFLVFRGTGPIGFHFLSENLSFFTSSRFVASLHICVALHFPTSKTWMNEGKWQIM